MIAKTEPLSLKEEIQVEGCVIWQFSPQLAQFPSVAVGTRFPTLCFKEINGWKQTLPLTPGNSRKQKSERKTKTRLIKTITPLNSFNLNDKWRHKDLYIIPCWDYSGKKSKMQEYAPSQTVIKSVARVFMIPYDNCKP